MRCKKGENLWISILRLFLSAGKGFIKLLAKSASFQALEILIKPAAVLPFLAILKLTIQCGLKTDAALIDALKDAALSSAFGA